MALTRNYNTSRNNIIAKFYKTLLNSAYLCSRARLAKSNNNNNNNKNRNISRYQITNWLKIWFLFFVSTKRETRDKIELRKFPSELLNPSRSFLKCFIIFIFYLILLYFYFFLLPGILELWCLGYFKFTVTYNNIYRKKSNL